ncbi:MAG: methyltransferase domain-containing protein, partial [Myxococcales bacterium]|nr:methyltransferase domain-containing protein [Myxococcales bacterium]
MACGHVRAPAAQSSDPAASPPSSTTVIDASTIQARTHALLDAYDRADEASFDQAVGGRFVQIDEDRISERAAVLSDLRTRRARGARDITRTYLEEHSWVGAGSAVYYGEAIEHWPPEGKRPTEFDGWSTVVWAREGAGWKVVSWQWVRGGLDGARRNWNATFRGERGLHLHDRPSAFLVRMVSGRSPGRALDVAMGQGRNTLYLASQGWQVTGFDISDEALRQARVSAEARKLRIDIVNADMDTWDYGSERWDLVALIYAGPICDGKKLA